MKTYKDVYELPLKKWEDYCGRVYDKKDNFVFEFLINGKNNQNTMLDVINGNQNYNKSAFKHEQGIIKTDETNAILIRGWGNLTGKGGMNLSGEEASNIQNTFADFIVEQLNRRKP